jgi:hypothetical protein
MGVGLPVNDTRTLAVERLHPWCHQVPHRVVVPGCVIGVVSVETLDSRPRSGDAARRSGRRASRDQRVTICLVTGVRSVEGCGEVRIGFGVTVHRTNTSRCFEATDPGGRERTGQPEPGRERRTVVEYRRHFRNYRESKMTARDDSRLSAQGTADLSLQIEPVAHSLTRSRPVTKSHNWTRKGTGSLSAGTPAVSVPNCAGVSFSMTT